MCRNISISEALYGVLVGLNYHLGLALSLTLGLTLSLSLARFLRAWPLHNKRAKVRSVCIRNTCRTETARVQFLSRLREQHLEMKGRKVYNWENTVFL